RSRSRRRERSRGPSARAGGSPAWRSLPEKQPLAGEDHGDAGEPEQVPRLPLEERRHQHREDRRERQGVRRDGGGAAPREAEVEEERHDRAEDAEVEEREDVARGRLEREGAPRGEDRGEDEERAVARRPGGRGGERRPQLLAAMGEDVPDRGP